MDYANQLRKQEALDRLDAMLAELEAERPNRERRLLQEAGSELPQDPPTLPASVTPPERTSAAERRGRRDWQAEAVWINGLINRKVAGELVEGIGIALRTALDEEREAMRAEFAAEIERRIVGLRQEVTALLTDVLREAVFHLGDGNRELIAAVDRRMERLDRLFDSMARSELAAWPREGTMRPAN